MGMDTLPLPHSARVWNSERDESECSSFLNADIYRLSNEFEYLSFLRLGRLVVNEFALL